MGGASWKAAFHDTQLFYIYGCFVVAIGRMKMRRCVFVPKHLNDDAIELANGGHGVVSIKNSHRLVLGFAMLYRTFRLWLRTKRKRRGYKPRRALFAYPGPLRLRLGDFQ